MQQLLLDEKYYIRMINNISTDFHNRCNTSIEEILRGRDAKEEFLRLLESIRYVCNDKENIVMK